MGRLPRGARDGAAGRVTLGWLVPLDIRLLGSWPLDVWEKEDPFSHPWRSILVSHKKYVSTRVREPVTSETS